MSDLATLKLCWDGAKPGDKFIYYTGYLSKQRNLVGKTKSGKELSKQVNEIADYFYDLYSQGLATLVQRRQPGPFHRIYGPFIHDYIVIKKQEIKNVKQI